MIIIKCLKIVEETLHYKTYGNTEIWKVHITFVDRQKNRNVWRKHMKRKQIGMLIFWQ